MSAEIDISISEGPVRGVPVPLTSVDVTPITGPCSLVGWSLREAAGEIPASAEGSVTSPAALTTIATTGSLPAGTYTVNWTVSLAGAVAAGDANNFQLVDSAGVVVASLNAGAAGSYPQPVAGIVTTVAGPVSVRNNLIGTVGAIYGAELDVVPSLGIAAIVELQDGNQPLGEIGIAAQESESVTITDGGLRVSQQVKVHMIAGAIVGVLWVRFDKQSP